MMDLCTFSRLQSRVIIQVVNRLRSSSWELRLEVHGRQVWSLDRRIQEWDDVRDDRHSGIPP